MDKENAICAMEYYPAIKKEGNSAFCNHMDGPRGYHAKWNKSDRESTYCMCSLTCGIHRGRE